MVLHLFRKLPVSSLHFFCRPLHAFNLLAFNLLATFENSEHQIFNSRPNISAPAGSIQDSRTTVLCVSHQRLWITPGTLHTFEKTFTGYFWSACCDPDRSKARLHSTVTPPIYGRLF